jgi:hypothetical protein
MKSDRLHIDCTAPVILKNGLGHSAIDKKKMMEEFLVSLAPSDRMIPLEVFDQKFLVELDLKESFALGAFATVLQLKLMSFLLVLITLFERIHEWLNDMHLLGEPRCFISTKLVFRYRYFIAQRYTIFSLRYVSVKSPIILMKLKSRNMLKLLHQWMEFPHF